MIVLRNNNWNWEIVEMGEAILNCDEYQDLNAVTKDNLIVNLMETIFDSKEISDLQKVIFMQLIDIAVKDSFRFRHVVIHRWDLPDKYDDEDEGDLPY
jgi:hypothetical protein